MASGEFELTEDAFLGGAVMALQPGKGYRAGMDAVLLAAAAPVAVGCRILDIGAGVGVVGLCIAARVADARIVLLERQPVLADLARRNAGRNGLDARVAVVQGDVAGNAAALTEKGVAPDSFDLAVANPPYGVEGRGRAPVDASKAAAHAMPIDSLEDWARLMARVVRPGGSAVVIHRAEALPELLGVLASRFGGIRICPVHAKAGAPAIRVLVIGTKGSRAPLSLLAPLVLHGPDGRFRPEVEAALRAPAALPVLAAERAGG